MTFVGLPWAAVIFGVSLVTFLTVLLYLLRPTPRPQTVSNVDFWARAAEKADPRGGRSRHVPLLALLLSLLVALLIVVLVGDPRLGEHADAVTVAVVDAGRSMAVRGPLGSTGADTARQLLLALAVQSTNPGRISVVRAGLRPSLLLPLTGEVADVRQVLPRLEPDDGPADLEGAIDLADHIISGLADPRRSRIVVIGSSRPALPSRTSTVWFVPAGQTGETVALTAFGARRDPHALGEFEVFCRVEAFSQRPATARLVIDDGHETILDQTLRLQPRRPVTRTASGSVEGRLVVTARLEDIRIEGARDGLDRDDAAVAVIEPLGSLRVLMVGAGGRYLTAALEVDPAVEIERIDAARFDPREARDYDVLVLDRVVPPGAMDHPGVMVVTPPPGATDLPSTAPVGEVPLTAAAPEHPVLRAVELEGVHVTGARPLRPSPTIQPLLRGGRSILAATRNDWGHRLVVLAFPLDHTNLVERPAFPLLIHNALVWLADRSQPVRSSRRTGQPIEFSGDRATVVRPDGRRVVARGGRYYDTARAGLYQVEGEPHAVSAVELAGPLPSEMERPSDDVALSEPFLPFWVTLLLLTLLVLEWFLFHRGRL